MRFSLIALLLATTVFTSAQAAEIKTDSHIAAVTVYPVGADVERVLEVQLPAGESALVLENLPSEVDPRTIRVTGAGGEGLQIGSVDTRTVSIPVSDQTAARTSFQKQQFALVDEQTSLEKLLDDLEVQKKLILGIAPPQLNPTVTSDKVVAVDSGQIAQLIDLVGAKLNAISKAQLDAQIRLRTVKQGIRDLEIQLSETAKPPEEKIEAVVNVIAASEMSAGFKVKYRVRSASWVPYYDAFLTTGNKDRPAKIELIRRAQVVQATSEVWDNVALTLSTANTQGMTRVGDVREEDVFEAVGDELEASGLVTKTVTTGADLLAEPMGSPPLSPSKEEIEDQQKRQRVVAAQLQARTEIAGFQALYAIPEKVVIDNSGTAKKLRIASESYDAKMMALTAPVGETTAYLTAVFTMKQEAPLLAGRVNLYRDEAFIGEGEIPQLNRGQEVKLGFGADDLIKVTRHDTNEKSSQLTGLTPFNTVEQAWEIEVQNLHDFTMPITVIDQIPYSPIADIVVTANPDMTPPTSRNYNNERGVYAWDFELEPQGKKLIKFGDKITWPRDLRSLQPQPAEQR